MSEPPARDRPYRGTRAFDLAVLALLAIPALLVAVPCGIVSAVTSRGPVLFRQERAGQHGIPFVCLKFRTMVRGFAESGRPYPSDDEVTGFGRFLRRWSFDELPQLWNVLKGDMSLVGPRPTLAYQVERYTDEQRRRLMVRPGITGLAQVSGRNAIPWAERIEADLRYIDHQSAWLDLRILVRTVAVTLRREGSDAHPADDPISIPND